MYKELIARFPNFSILVIGDLMLDVYLQGASNRLTPEAPVPVVDILSTITTLGGAANTAANLKHLGARVTFCSVTGRDKESNHASAMFNELGINSLLVRRINRKTMVKTRVVAGDQLITRFDSGSDTHIDAEMEREFIDLVEEQFEKHDAIVIADYNKGLFTPAIISALQSLRLRHEKFIAVDSKRLELFKDLSPSLAKPNYTEVVQLTGLHSRHNGRTKQVSEHGAEIAAKTGAAITAVTLDEEGAIIFAGNLPVYRCCAHPGVPLLVAGAGDTYISAFTLASLAGAGIPAAAELSAAAAAVAVSKNTTACCTRQELTAYLSINEKYVSDLEQLQHTCAMYRAQGKKIVFTNGCFDILHSGHVNYLNRARELGHILVVGINTDDSISRLKGSGRPINRLQDRMEVLGGLSAVNHIVPFGDAANDTAMELIRHVKPDIFVKGGDYTKEQLPEAPLVEAMDGEVILLPLLPDRSTTLIVNNIQNKYKLQLAEPV